MVHKISLAWLLDQHNMLGWLLDQHNMLAWLLDQYNTLAWLLDQHNMLRDEPIYIYFAFFSHLFFFPAIFYFQPIFLNILPKIYVFFSMIINMYVATFS